MAAPIANIPEKLLARLWQKRAARQQEFRTGGGRRVRVLYPGRASAAAGPDFRDALLEVEGLGLVQGDVELHVRQQDWYAHGHADDPNYNGVILHAALETSPQVTRLQSGHQAPVISLTSLLDDEDGAETRAGDTDTTEPTTDQSSGDIWAILEQRGWPRPATAAGLGELLDAAGDARFRAKSAEFHTFMQEQSAAQTLYEGLMEGLGYRANRQPFLKLAHAAPWSALAREVAARPAAEPVQVAQIIERRLLKLSGLAPEPGRPAPARAPAGGGYGAPLNAAEWHCFRVRPANHPRHRIAGAARLFARFLTEGTAETESVEAGLIAGLEKAVNAGNAGKLTAALTVPADPGQRTAYVGAARAKDLAVNVALPFLHALAPADDSSPARQLYHNYGKLQDNELTREMAALLPGQGSEMESETEPGWGKVITTARRQQGLIHLYRQLAGG